MKDPTCRSILQPDGQAAESYRVLRNGLDFVNFEHDVKVVLVTSAVAQEGKSTVAANLASVLAQSGKKTVLIESDFRRPIAGRFFGVSENVGLSDVLTGAFDAALRAAATRSASRTSGCSRPAACPRTRASSSALQR